MESNIQKPDYLKSEREQRINELCSGVVAAAEGEAKKQAQRELLDFIEGHHG